MQKKVHWLDHKQNVTRLYLGLWVVGFALLIADLVIHRHEDLWFAEWFGFYAAYGFFACVALVLAAKALRRVLMRDEDFYES